MSVKGQDERLRSARGKIADLPSMPVDDIFAAGYRAALVDSEARERELVARAARAEARIGELEKKRAKTAIQGREAVLVEALKEIGALAQREWDRAPIDAIAAILKAALAGVVEAEPCRRCKGTGGYIECDEDGEEMRPCVECGGLGKRVEAEPDGSER